MGIFENNLYPILETVIGDLKINSVFDRGFLNVFGMFPELHTHSYYELLFAVDDGFFVELEKSDSLYVESGGFCLIPPEFFHGTRPASEKSRKLAIRFRFTKDFDASSDISVYQSFYNAMKNCKSAVVLSDNNDMTSVIRLLRSELEKGSIASKEMTEALLVQFYVLLLRKFDTVGESADKMIFDTDFNDKEFRRIWIEEYFQQNYKYPVTEEKMAEKMNLSKRQVSRILQEIYGKSFRKLLIDERLSRASQLLLSTDASVEEIALSVGYTSLSGFYSAFNNKFGVSVGEYRRKFIK